MQAVRQLGRAGKCSAAVMKQLADLVQNGCTRETAAQASGLTSRSLRRWMERAALGEEPYSTLERMLDEALAMYLARLSAAVTKDAVLDGRLALEVLSRRDPAAWGRRDQLAVSGPGGGPLQVEAVKADWSLLTDQEKDTLMALMDKALPKRQVLIEGVMQDDVDTDSEAA